MKYKNLRLKKQPECRVKHMCLWGICFVNSGFHKLSVLKMEPITHQEYHLEMVLEPWLKRSPLFRCLDQDSAQSPKTLVAHWMSFLPSLHRTLDVGRLKKDSSSWKWVLGGGTQSSWRELPAWSCPACGLIVLMDNQKENGREVLPVTTATDVLPEPAHWVSKGNHGDWGLESWGCVPAEISCQ